MLLSLESLQTCLKTGLKIPEHQKVSFGPLWDHFQQTLAGIVTALKPGLELQAMAAPLCLQLDVHDMDCSMPCQSLSSHISPAEAAKSIGLLAQSKHGINQM